MPASPNDKLPTTAGCELEFNGFTSLAGRNNSAHESVAKATLVQAGIDSFDVSTDGSCGFTGGQGVEARSKIMTTEADIVELGLAAKALKAAGGVTNHFCGMHVHLGYNGKDKIARYRFARFVVRHEATFFDLADVSRKGNQFCQKLPDEVRAKLVKGDGFATAFGSKLIARGERSAFNTDRRIWINVQALEKYGTFENRLWHGTLDQDMVLGWINTQLQMAKLTLVDCVKFDWETGLDSPKARIKLLIKELCHDDTPRCTLVKAWLTERMRKLELVGLI